MQVIGSLMFERDGHLKKKEKCIVFVCYYNFILYIKLYLLIKKELWYFLEVFEFLINSFSCMGYYMYFELSWMYV